MIVLTEEKKMKHLKIKLQGKGEVSWVELFEIQLKLFAPNGKTLHWIPFHFWMHSMLSVICIYYCFQNPHFTRWHDDSTHDNADIFDALIARFIGRRGRRGEGMGILSITQNTTSIVHIMNITSIIQTSNLSSADPHTNMSATVYFLLIF